MPAGFWTLEEAVTHATNKKLHIGYECNTTKRLITGNRYTWHTTDLCETAYMRLPADEQEKYTKVPPPDREATAQAIRESKFQL